MAQLQSSSITGSLIISSSGTDSTTNSLLVTNGAGYEYLKVTDGGTVDVRPNLIVNHATNANRSLRFSWGSIYATDTNNELTLGSVYTDNTATRIYISGKNSDNSPSNAISMQAGNGVAIFSGTNNNLFDPQALLHVSGAGIFTGDLDVTGSLHVLGDLTVGKISNQSELVDVGGNFNFDTVAEPTSAERTNFSSSIISSAGNVDNGTHYYHVIYKTSDGGETGAYGTPFLAATITDNTTAGQVELTGIPTSSDARVTARDIYRSEANGNQYYSKKLATISDNTTTTYTDNLADSSLDQNTLFYRKANSTAGYFYKDNNLFAQAGNAHYTSFGVSALESVTIGQDNIAFGGSALQNTTSGRENTAIGYSSGVNNTTGYGNTYLGYVAGYFNETGVKNTAVGGFALRQVALTSANYNTAVGHGALWKLTGNNNHNTAIGHAAGQGYQGLSNIHIGSYAGYKSTEGSGGDYNINIGYYTGNDTTGDNNILIGRQLEAPNSGSNNQLNIGNLIYATGLGLGDTLGTGNVGIGNANPTHTVEIGTDGGGEKILKMHSDTASSYFEIQSLGNVARLLTTNNTNLLLQSDGTGGYITFNANSAERMRIDSSGRLLLNSTSTSFSDKLYINGDAYVNGGWRVGTSSTYVGKLYNASGILTLESDSTRDIQFGSVTNGTAMFIEGTNGNVGIGVDNPSDFNAAATNLVVGTGAGSNGISIYSGTNSAGGIYFADESGSGAGNRDGVINYNHSSATMDFKTGGNQRLLSLNTSTSTFTLGDVVMENNLTVKGIVTAQEFHTEFVSASIVYQSGSTKFGDTSDDIHSFTGSLQVLGAINRPFSVTDGRAFHQGESGGWRLEYGFKGSSGTDRGGFGAQGGNDTVTYYYIGSTQSNPTLAATPGGNVGIGTTSPDTKLHVVTSGASKALNLYQASYQQFQFKYTDTYQSSFEFGSLGNLMYEGNGGYLILENKSTQAGSRIVFKASGSEYMRITHDGNVGIGTTSPATKIDVDGTGRITDTVYLSTNTNSKVGIGTSSPVSKLHIIHTDASLDTLRVGRSDNSSYWRVNHAGNDFRLFNVDTSGADILFGVDSGGFIQNNRVGIQVANPTAQLHISSSGTPFKMERGGYDTYGFVQSTGNGLQVQNFTDARTEMFFKGDGTVGIGTTSPNAGLEVANAENSTLRLTRNSNTGNYLQLQGGSSGAIYNINTSGTQDHIFQTGGNEKMRITSAGNVGIGTTSPSDKLQVDGRIRIKSNSGLFIDTSATYGASSAANFEVINDASSNPVLRILNAGNGSFRNISINTYSGKLGIGTLNPTEKLTVEGNISASGDLDVTGNITTTGAVKLDGVDGLYFNQGSTSTSSPTPGIFYSGTSGQGWYFQVPNNGQEKFSFKLGSTDVNREFRVVDPSWNPLFQVQGTGDAIIANNLTVGGTVTAQEFHTEFVSASIIYQSGSTKFGDTADDIHSFTGSLEVSASIKMTGDGHAYTYPLEITSDSIKLPSNNASSRSILRQAGAGTGAFLSLRNGSGDERVMIRSYDSGGVQAFFTAGNVGIGTTSPSQKLQVTTGINDGFKVSNNTNSSYTSIQNFSSGPVLNMYDSNPVNTVRIRSYASSGVQAYFTAGNVGIGTTSPSSKLHVSGAADVLLIEGSGSTANTSIFAIDGNNGRLFEVSDDLSDSLFSVNTIAGLPVVEVFADNRVTMGAFNQNDFVISGSKIGIGTSAPVSLLTLEGTVGGDPMLRLKSTGTTTSEDAYMAFNRDNTNTQGYTIGLDSGDNSFKISEDGDSITGNNRVTILTGGNVGIGTTSPQRLFDVNGDVRVKRNIYGADGNYIGFFVDGGSAIPIKARSLALTTNFANNAPTNGLYVQGDVGIGVLTPAYKLDVSGSINHAGASYTVPATTSGASGATTVLTGATFDNATLIKASHDGVSTGNYTLELPAASSSTNRTIRIISDSSTDANHNVVIVPTSGDTLDGGTSGFTINRNYEGLMVWSDGTEWFVIQSKNV